MSPTMAAPPAHPSFLLGRSASGLWVLRDVTGLQSGTFRSREAAIRFAQIECGDRHPPVTLVPEVVEPLRLGGRKD